VRFVSIAVTNSFEEPAVSQTVVVVVVVTYFRNYHVLLHERNLIIRFEKRAGDRGRKERAIKYTYAPSMVVMRAILAEGRSRGMRRG